MHVDQEQLRGHLAELLAQVIINAENSNSSSEQDSEQVLLAWQTECASYKLVREITQFQRQSINLSQREREIVQLIMQGISNKGIARALDISPNTVGTYIRRVFLKLGVCTRAEMVSRVLRDGLLEDQSHTFRDGFFDTLH